MYTGIQWETLDEVNFMRQLRADGKLKTLLKYRESLAQRSFDGRGMCVEPEKVEAEAVRLTADLDERGDRDASFEGGRGRLGGLENEWVGRRDLRAYPQRRMAD